MNSGIWLYLNAFESCAASCFLSEAKWGSPVTLWFDQRWWQFITVLTSWNRHSLSERSGAFPSTIAGVVMTSQVMSFKSLRNVLFNEFRRTFWSSLLPLIRYVCRFQDRFCVDRITGQVLLKSRQSWKKERFDSLFGIRFQETGIDSLFNSNICSYRM